MTRKVLITSNEAVPAKVQHTHPCSDCPWRRDALPGWLGPATAAEWVQAAHSDQTIECHALDGAQCAGAAIYRANVCKASRDPEVLRLPADRTAVFGWPTEFIKHHEGR